MFVLLLFYNKAYNSEDKINIKGTDRPKKSTTDTNRRIILYALYTRTEACIVSELQPCTWKCKENVIFPLAHVKDVCAKHKLGGTVKSLKKIPFLKFLFHIPHSVTGSQRKKPGCHILTSMM